MHTETNMTAIDHLFVFVIAIVYPIAGYISFNRLLRKIAAGEHIDRANLYTVTIMGHWTLFGMLMAIWLATERSWDAIGFGLTTDTWFLVGAALTVIGIVLLVLQLRQVATADTAEITKICGQIGKLKFIIPRNGNELGRFYALSLTAGIVEEALWRGFMIWYLAQVMPVWAAAVISALGFGLAHAYQGAGNLPRVTLVGAAFVALYLLTGSLWLPMVLHAAVDILQGRVAYEVIRRADNADDSADNASAVQA